MSFGSQLKEARKNAKMTQEELAKSVCTTKAAISRYESGQRIPNAEMFTRLCFVLQLDADAVLDLAKIAGISAPQLAHGFEKFLNSQIEESEEYMQSERLKTDAIVALIKLSIQEQVASGLLDAFLSLNPTGQQKAVERVEELTEIPKYTRSEEDKK